MIKKILFIIFISITSIGFSQEESISNLSANPNPFSSNTLIQFSSQTPQNIFITVKNILGKTVYRGYIAAKKGKNSFPFERKDLMSGIYIYAIQSNTDFISKRFVIN